MIPMVFEGVREDQNVVKINNNENVRDIREHFIHEMLKGGRGIGESKGHDQILKRTIAGSESCHPLLAFLDADIVVTRSEVNFGVDLGIP